LQLFLYRIMKVYSLLAVALFAVPVLSDAGENSFETFQNNDEKVERRLPEPTPKHPEPTHPKPTHPKPTHPEPTKEPTPKPKPPEPTKEPVKPPTKAPVYPGPGPAPKGSKGKSSKGKGKSH
jgi:outer membrane biosynthesis protein TonB